MTFEEWWKATWDYSLGPGIMCSAFKEIAKSAWDARQAEIDNLKESLKR